MIDLRSDTVTRPTKAMLEAMYNAKVGDDVFEEDPTVIKLEQKLANYFGLGAGIFCPSGTMTNQIAVHLHCPPHSEVICDEKSHIYLYEGGGVAYNTQASLKFLRGDRGRIRADMIEDKINNPEDVHAPITTLVSLENSMNKGGGSTYDMQEIASIAEVCQRNGLKLHLDGARIFNALVFRKDKPTDYGRYFDSISVCLSKGLGCPVGSVLLGSREFIRKARRIRKVLGGGMRQVGFIAAAGLHAIDHHIDRLEEDHRRAKEIEAALQPLNWVHEVMPVETNIVIASLPKPLIAKEVVAKLEEEGCKIVPFGKHEIRFTTHLDFTETDLNRCIEILKTVKI